MTSFDLNYFLDKIKDVESLDLNGHLIGDTGVRHLAEALAKKNNISWLDLQYNRIGPEGAKSIADVLKCNCKITDLYMNGNIIRAEGARAIAASLRTNRCIQRIFGVYLRPEAKKEFNLMQDFDYEPGNSTIIRAVREKIDKFRLRHEFIALKYLVDRERLLNLPCRLDDVDRRVIQLTVGITDLPFYIIVSYLSS